MCLRSSSCPLFSFSACRCGTLSASTHSFSASWYLILWHLEPICNGSPLFPTRQRSYPAILHDQGLIHQCSVESLLIILALAYFVPIHPRECGHISSDNNCLLVFPLLLQVLYPPLTYLKPRGQPETVEVTRDGKVLALTIVEVVPELGGE